MKVGYLNLILIFKANLILLGFLLMFSVEFMLISCNINSIKCKLNKSFTALR